MAEMQIRSRDPHSSISLWADRCIDCIVTLICWAWFTLGFILFFSWRYIAYVLIVITSYSIHYTKLYEVRSPYISPDLTVDADGFFTAGDRVEAKEENRFALKGRADMVTKVGGKRVDLEA